MNNIMYFFYVYKNRQNIYPLRFQDYHNSFISYAVDKFKENKA